MWSKFTEYAEGIVEIVAQADATAAAAVAATDNDDDTDAAATSESNRGSRIISTHSPPRSTSSKAVAAATAAALSGEEIWSRFASIVAPPSDAPSSQKASRTSTTSDATGASGAANARMIAAAAGDPQSAPLPLDQLHATTAASDAIDRLATQTTATAVTTTVTSADEDEQEQYICELERALLQRKKQNEALEKKMYELEFRHTHELQQVAQSRIPSDTEAPADDAALVAKIETLEQQLRAMDKRCSALQLTLEIVQQPASTSSSPARARLYDEATSSDALVAVVQTLTAALGDSRDVGAYTDDSALVAQIQTLAASAERKIQDAVALERAVAAFLMRHSDVASAASEPAASTNVSTQLERVSAQLTQYAAAATDAARVHAKLLTLQDKEEEQLKKVLHLQAQVASLHANAHKTDASLQQTVTKEVELLDTLEDRDATIRQLEASLKQVKASMEHLAGELKDAQNYTDELEGFCRRQKKELDAQRSRVKELESVTAQLEALEVQERETRERATEYEHGYVALLAEIEALKAQNEAESKRLVASTEAHAASTESQAIYDLEARLSASEADKLVALQDAARLQKSVDALEDVLHQFQVDQKQQRQQLLELETALATAHEQQQQQIAAAAARRARPDDSDSSDLQRVVDVLAKKTLECEQLREALENTAARYSADNDVLDKRLAAQLVVAYCETEKKGEVLQLIAGMMGFSDDQKRRVGLGFPIDGNGGGGLFSSLLGFVAPSPSDGAPVANIDGKSFADIWTEFLLAEAKK